MYNQVLTLETDSKLPRNILKFGYGIHYKYEGQLSHSIDKYYVVKNLTFQY